MKRGFSKPSTACTGFRSQPMPLHSFAVDSATPVSHIRFNLHPDGGVSRLRLWGLPAGEAI